MRKQHEIQTIDPDHVAHVIDGVCAVAPKYPPLRTRDIFCRQDNPRMRRARAAVLIILRDAKPKPSWRALAIALGMKERSVAQSLHNRHENDPKTREIVDLTRLWCMQHEKQRDLAVAG